MFWGELQFPIGVVRLCGAVVKNPKNNLFSGVGGVPLVIFDGRLWTGVLRMCVSVGSNFFFVCVENCSFNTVYCVRINFR